MKAINGKCYKEFTIEILTLRAAGGIVLSVSTRSARVLKAMLPLLMRKEDGMHYGAE